VTGWWFSPGTHKTDLHNITEILLKVALNTINQTKSSSVSIILRKFSQPFRIKRLIIFSSLAEIGLKKG
jgi:hypothetical protein